MICIKQGNDLYIRSDGWSHHDDFVWKCSIVNSNNWAGNRFFNIEGAYTCPANNPIDDLSKLSFWKESHDDICPVNVQGTYIGANHGFNCVDEVTAPSHGKTQSDIGSVWTDCCFRTYCLVKVPDENTLCLVMFNADNMLNGKMCYGTPTGTLIHSHGAVHKENITITTRRNSQLWQCFNHYSIKLHIDEKEHNIHDDFVHQCDTFTVQTEYDIIYIPAMLNYLMSRAGSNTNESQHSEEINESYFRLLVRYEFHNNGSISTYSSFYINKELDVGYIGLVQSMPIADSPYAYIPDTAFDQLTIQNSTDLLSITKDTWNSEKKAPYRYYQFEDISCHKGMALVYDRGFGWGANSLRLSHLEHAGMYYTSRKQYPAFISGGTLSAGDYFDGFAVRIPLNKYDDEITAICWYWIGSDIILMVDSHQSVNKEIILPYYMNGKHIETLDRTQNCKMNQKEIIDCKINFHTDGYGYLVVRLFSNS